MFRSKKQYWQSIVVVVTRSVRPALALALIAVVAIGAIGPVHASRSATSTRPISDFLSQQGTYCLDDGMGGCFLFVPPSPNFLGWADLQVVKFALVDYAGLANATYGGIFGTQTRGTIVERPLADGRADVTVTLHTSKALTWVSECCDFAGGPLIFGHRASDVVAGADAALGDAFLELSFTNTAPGAPLPDLIQLYFAPATGQQIHQFVFHANAKGTLADGSPGTVTITQTGNPTARTNLQASVINVRQTGH